LLPATAQTTAGFFSSRAHPARDFAANPRSTPLVPGNPRNLNDRPNRPEVFSGPNAEDGICRFFRSRRQQRRRHPAPDPASPARDQRRRRQADSGVSTLLLPACRLEGRRLALQCVGGVKSLRTVATAPPGAAAEPGGGCVTLALPSIRRSDAETGELFVERGVPHLREFHSLCAPRPSSWPRLDHAHLPGTRPRCDGETMRQVP